MHRLHLVRPVRSTPRPVRRSIALELRGAPSRGVRRDAGRVHSARRPAAAQTNCSRPARREPRGAARARRARRDPARTVGSTVHGLHHGGQDDRDEMAVFVEPPEYLLGLARARGIRGGLYGFEHCVERTQPEGARSGPGDLDLVAYSLRKYVRLALKGHPTILLLLFVPPELDARRDRARARSCASCGRRSSRGAPAAATSATCAARRSGCSARAGRSGSTGPSSSRRTASTRSTRCTRPGSATRASSCSRPER